MTNGIAQSRRAPDYEVSNILLKIADRLERNLEKFAVAETWGNGKPVRETLAAELPLTIDHSVEFPALDGGMEARSGIGRRKPISRPVARPA